MDKEGKDILFVGVREPEEVRRSILESLKDIVGSLQRFEKFKDARKEKIDKINKLGKIVKETNKIVSDLKNSLPKTKIRVIKISKPKTEEKKRHPRKKEVVAEVKEKKPVSELEKLQSELSEIESKLSSLG